MPLKVLVVDDDVHLRRLMTIYLRDEGHDVAQAGGGEEALHLAAREHFDVALVDLILPQYGGPRLCEKLKALNAPPRVIISSGDDSAQARELARKSGSDDFLAKPFTREQLLHVIVSAKERSG